MGKLKKIREDLLSLPEEELKDCQVVFLTAELEDDILKVNVDDLGVDYGLIRKFITEVLAQDEEVAKAIYTDIAKRKIKAQTDLQSGDIPEA